MVPPMLTWQESVQHMFMTGSIYTGRRDEASIVTMRPRASKLSVPLPAMVLSGIEMPQTIQSLRGLYDARSPWSFSDTETFRHSISGTSVTAPSQLSTIPQ